MTGDEQMPDELAEAVEDALTGDEAVRYSPAARRFLAGEMDDDEARRLGFLGDDTGSR